MSVWRLAITAVLILASVSSALPCRADEGSVPFRVELRAPAGCPNASDFARSLSGRGLTASEPSDNGRLIRGTIERTEKGVDAILDIVEPDGRASRRTVKATNCAEATEVLALIAAVAVAETKALVRAREAAPTPPPAVVPPAVAPPKPDPDPSASPRATTGRLSFEGGIAALGTIGMAPGPTFGTAGWIGIALSFKGSVWAPRLRVGIADTIDRSFSGPEGTATLGLFIVALEACPLSFGSFGSSASGNRPQVALSACARGEYGTFRAAGSSTENARSDPRTWAAAGLDANLSVGILGPVSAELSVGALAAFERERFFVGSDPLFTVAPVVGRGLFGLAATLP